TGTAITDSQTAAAIPDRVQKWAGIRGRLLAASQATAMRAWGSRDPTAAMGRATTTGALERTSRPTTACRRPLDDRSSTGAVKPSVRTRKRTGAERSSSDVRGMSPTTVQGLAPPSATVNMAITAHGRVWLMAARPSFTVPQGRIMAVDLTSGKRAASTIRTGPRATPADSISSDTATDRRTSGAAMGRVAPALADIPPGASEA